MLLLLLLLLQAKAQQELLQLSIREAGGAGAAAREELPLLTEIFVQVAAQWKTMKSRREKQAGEEREPGNRVPKTNG